MLQVAESVTEGCGSPMEEGSSSDSHPSNLTENYSQQDCTLYSANSQMSHCMEDTQVSPSSPWTLCSTCS